jgi:hypothetical protein
MTTILLSFRDSLFFTYIWPCAELIYQGGGASLLRRDSRQLISTFYTYCVNQDSSLQYLFTIELEMEMGFGEINSKKRSDIAH